MVYKYVNILLICVCRKMKQTDFRFVYRGLTEIKGKGMMPTYFLYGYTDKEIDSETIDEMVEATTKHVHINNMEKEESRNDKAFAEDYNKDLMSCTGSSNLKHHSGICDIL